MMGGVGRVIMATLAAALALAGCAAPAPTPIAVLAAPTVVPTATIVPTPTPIPATTIDTAYLARAGHEVTTAIAQGAARINNVASSCTPDEFGFGWVSQCWRRPIAPDDLPADPVAMLQFLVALGAFRDTAGVFYPGWQEQALVFGALDGLALPRVTLAQAPAAAAPDSPLVAPRGLIIRPGAQLTVLGLLSPADGAARVLVACSDPARQGWLATRHYLAVLPADGPGLTLAGLLALNGARYDAPRGVAWLTVAGEPTPVRLNTIADAALAAALVRAAGIGFVDELQGELLVEPVIPYPADGPSDGILPAGGLPARWALVSAGEMDALVLRNLDTSADLAVARYDRGQLAWVWESLPAAPDAP